MSDINIPGLSSKYNTSQLVKDLVAAEKLRLTGMEDEVDELETVRSNWRWVNRNLGELQRAMKSLYGFENPFAEKNAVIADERILTATASRNAAIESYSITVKQVATADRFLSDSLQKSYKVNKGDYSYSVGEETVTLNYRGGSLDDFAKRLSAKGKGILRASTVRDTSNTRVLLIEAIPTGSENRLFFNEDARSLAQGIGMLKPTHNPANRIHLDNLVVEESQQNRVSISDEAILIKPKTSFSLPLNQPIDLDDTMVLEYSYRTIEYSDEEVLPPAPPGPLWPEAPTVEYKGLTLESASNAITLPPESLWTPPERVDDGNILNIDGNPAGRALPPISRQDDFISVRVESSQLPEQVSALVVDNINTHRAIEIKNIEFFNPNAVGDMEPVHPMNLAGDAVLEFRGIEARRPTNTIDDLIDGITLNLKRNSADPVEVAIEPDSEVAKEGIIKAVFNYNQLLTRILILTTDNPAVLDELEYLDDDEREALEEQLGSFRGDNTLNQLKNRLQSIMSNPYPTSAGRDLASLAQIGISTNASSGSFSGSLNAAKLRGYLEINEEQLDQALLSDIDAVKELFGNDTSGDLLIDSGVAHTLDEYLTPYTRNNGLMSTRIKGVETQIKNKKDDISEYEDYLEDYEADLKRQYGNMEAMLNQLENSSRELDNFSRQQGSNR